MECNHWKYKNGLVLVLISSLCYGFMPVITQLAFHNGMATLTVIFGRFTLANVLYLSHIKIRSIPFRLSLPQFFLLLFLGSLAVAFCGILFITLGPGDSEKISAYGVFLGLIGAIFYGIPVMAANTLLLPENGMQLMHLLFLAVANSFIAMTCFYKAVRLIGASDASLFGTAEPLISCAAGAVVMHDSLSVGNLLGCALIVLSILFLNLYQRKNRSNRKERRLFQ